MEHGRDRGFEGRAVVGLARVVLGAALALGVASPAGASGVTPTGVIGVRWGGEPFQAFDGLVPAIGVFGGVRLHERVAVLMDATVAAHFEDRVHWSLLAGARVSPVLAPELRLDVDLRLGAGRSGPLSMGRYVTDDTWPESYPIVRLEATLLGSLGRRIGIGPQLRYEAQPLFVRALERRDDGTEAASTRMANRGHQVLIAFAWEADGKRHKDHLSWAIGGGVSVAGDGDDTAGVIHFSFTWTHDVRPERRAPTFGKE